MLQYVVIVVGLKQYCLFDEVCRMMNLVVEDIQLFQVLNIDLQYLCYEVCIVIGCFYDVFELCCDVKGGKQCMELIEGCIMLCGCLCVQIVKGCVDCCWE